jgi:hypothetical protein
MSTATLIAPDRNCALYVVAWHAHGDNWVEIARLPNNEDARAVALMFNNGLSMNALKNGECYAYFRLSDFTTVVQR